MPARHVVVLVEGESDAVVVRSVGRRAGLDERVEVVAMGGITNVPHHVRRLAAPGTALLGLCDLGERRHLERVDPPLAGVFVCDRDLEEELIRAVGTDGVLAVLDELDDRHRFHTFQGQPEWRDRPVADQLRRFAGTRSGRKAVLAAALAERLGSEDVPPPLAALVARAQQLVG